MRIAPRLLVLSLVVGCAPTEDDVDIEFRPAPGCPQCSLKKAQFTISPASQLGQNVEIGPAKLIHTVTYTHDCVNGQPTCVVTAREDLGVLEPGRYEEPLLLETDWDLGDTEEAEVDLTLLRANGSVAGHVTIEVDISEY